VQELTCDRATDFGHAGFVPAGMDAPEAVKIEPEQQRPKPVEVRGQFAGASHPSLCGRQCAVDTPTQAGRIVSL